MSTAACPNGHTSTDPEWCDTCGTRIGGPAAGPPQAAPSSPDPTATMQLPTIAPSGATVACPHCGTPNASDSLFCEQCGYDFTTGQSPPEEPAHPAPAPTTEPAPAAEATEWTVVVSVDPTWYSLKGTLAETPCPPVTSTTVPLAGHVALIGRTSQSRNIHPHVALDSDTGVSRRHAQLVLDNDTWKVVDLGSTNGTYVVAAGSTPTDDIAPLTEGEPRPLAHGDAVFVGAWTRIVLRHAAEED